MAKSPRKDRLRVQVDKGRLVISVGIDTLAFAFGQSEYIKTFDQESGEFRTIAKVLNAKKFAEDVAVALNREEDDGTTPVHCLLDAACQAAMEDGSAGLDFEENDHE